jgi:hypothetical protein
MATQVAGTERRAAQVLEVKLEDGETLTARVGDDPVRARSELDALHDRLEAETFVRVGDDTIVRSADVKFVRLRNEGESGGLLDVLMPRRGGQRMSTMDTERMERRGAEPEGGDRSGFRETMGEPREWFAYRRPQETKPFFLTSEFLILLAAVIGILGAASEAENLDASRAWLLVTIVAAAYMVSRGLAKAGTRHPGDRDRWDRYGGGGY